jgi:phosphoribosylformylglycinamidine synthase I
MKAGVITFPGSNCDDDLVYILSKSCGFQVDRLWHKDSPDLSVYDLVALPGGFSYGDYLRCGAMASVSPIIPSVRRFAEGGGFLAGICNGFQILCEIGLLPGALAKNEKINFVCRDVSLRVDRADSPWTSQFKNGDIVSFPIAHSDGRYVVSDAQHEEMKKNGQVLFTYADSISPNGSTFGIAGIANAQGNILGLMPHPERATDLRSRDGGKLWQSLVSSIRARSEKKS